jgi:hypothetical protein
MGGGETGWNATRKGGLKSERWGQKNWQGILVGNARREYGEYAAGGAVAAEWMAERLRMRIWTSVSNLLHEKREQQTCVNSMDTGRTIPKLST